MLTHLIEEGHKPARAVVLGAHGFVGQAAVRKLDAAGVPLLGLGRRDIDLHDPNAAQTLAARLRPGDAVVVVSARAPVKNNAMLIENITMMSAVCDAIASVPPAHVIYISSDAVYADSDGPLTEASCAQPGSLHGAMHLARELMLANAFAGPLCLLRPTLIHGPNDPHNGYGPNRFRRLAEAGQPIVLFGGGEERRDHVYVDDVGEIIARVAQRRSTGVLNIATGTVHSFRDVADAVVADVADAAAADVAARIADRPSVIQTTKRVGPMPHNGYRAFDVAATFAAFPGFEYTPLARGISLSRGA
jgi:nucleoside-diphosphate-sugar epimerase